MFLRGTSVEEVLVSGSRRGEEEREERRRRGPEGHGGTSL